MDKLLTWSFFIPESDIDKNKMHDDGTPGVCRVLEDVALLKTLPVHDRGVDLWKWHIVEAGPLHSKHQLLQRGEIFCRFIYFLKIHFVNSPTSVIKAVFLLLLLHMLACPLQESSFSL